MKPSPTPPLPLADICGPLLRGHVAGIAYLYGDSQTAMYGFVAALFACAVAVVLNTIDETPKEFEQ